MRPTDRLMKLCQENMLDGLRCAAVLACAVPVIALALYVGLAGDRVLGSDALVVVLLSAMASAGFLLLALRQLLAPLEALTRTLEKLADREIGPQLPESGTGELARMSRAVNLLIRGMERRIELATASDEVDALTGALRRSTFERLAGDPVTGAVLYLDIDGFDGLNNRFGRPAGDLVLREFGRVVAVTIRDDDVFCRLEGEDFLVCLKGAPEKAAMGVSERIRSDIESRLRVKGQAVTVSIGISIASSPVPLETMIERAESGMQEARAGGGNRVCRAGADQASGTDARVGETSVAEIPLADRRKNQS